MTGELGGMTPLDNLRSGVHRYVESPFRAFTGCSFRPNSLLDYSLDVHFYSMNEDFGSLSLVGPSELFFFLNLTPVGLFESQFILFSAAKQRKKDMSIR